MGLKLKAIEKQGNILNFNSKIRITIKLKKRTTNDNLIIPIKWKNIVSKYVRNPEDLKNYPERNESNLLEDIEYLIITNEDMQSAFEELREWKNKKGVPTEIVTVEQIYSEMPGRDEPEQIRNYIKQFKEQKPLIWVLIGGDVPVVPVRYVHCRVEVPDFYEDEDDIATDLYYSDLDGSWDENGNNVFGEIEDNIDFLPDVLVGRLPVDTLEQAQGVISKMITYETNPPIGYETKVLFIADYTGFYDIYSSLAKDPMENSAIAPQCRPVYKLYDDWWNYENAYENTREAQIEQLNSGYHIINHLGHGLSSTLGYLRNSDVDALENGDKTGIYFSCACYSGSFQNSVDAAGERWVLNPNGGGIAFIGNTNVGIGFPSGVEFDEEILKGFYFLGRNHLGEMFGIAKAQFREEAFQENHPHRWTQYVLNLLGEPELTLWSDVPVSLTVQHSPYFYLGENLFHVDVQDYNGAVDRALVTIYQKNVLLYRKYTDPAGRATFNFITTEPETLFITVTKENHIPYLGIAEPTSNTPTPTPYSTPTPTFAPTNTPTPTPTATSHLSTPTPKPTCPAPTNTPEPGTLPQLQIGNYWNFKEYIDLKLEIDLTLLSLISNFKFFKSLKYTFQQDDYIPAILSAETNYLVTNILNFKQERSENTYNCYEILFRGIAQLHAYDFYFYGIHIKEARILDASYSGNIYISTEDFSLVHRERIIQGVLEVDYGSGFAAIGEVSLVYKEEYVPPLNSINFPIVIGNQNGPYPHELYCYGSVSAMGFEQPFFHFAMINTTESVIGLDCIKGWTTYLIQEDISGSGIPDNSNQQFWFYPSAKWSIQQYMYGLDILYIERSTLICQNFGFATLTPTPLPTSTSTPLPTYTPTITPSQPPTSTPTPTSTPQPKFIFSAGFFDTYLSSSHTSTLKIIALAEPTDDIIEVLYQGLPTGIYLYDDGKHNDFMANDGIYANSFQIPEGLNPQTILLELKFKKYLTLNIFPYLIVK